MDVADSRTGPKHLSDDVGDRCQKLFQDFLEEFKNEQNELKYIEDARNLVKPERSTLQINFPDVESYNQNLAQAIQEDYYRVYPYLCNAVRNFVKDRIEVNVEKQFYVSFVGVHILHKLHTFG
ncbi:DNA replication licensing factor Mcm6-like [Centruroides sculpturatus]|uniref:DNA replication licensing factor Mcm6-like n=1 Tax=Centruroides sculpturatus TaxID=218467 RepID=UPI000C6D9BCB|nr:DNA replication licensing factor Mcm6-like [Centruroides sculpturatus]